ncbi:helix-turn-helix domain-containing protein [Streptomyces jumonjinensis]|uniref:helix-turn-helix domain-containing protein n=1 Tax=Streptomyces jumonjinensis TaxID=1945 RepID=UPI0037916468
MARWKALPEELDPEVREFAEQLRRLVDRSGLSIAAVSDHTGYSKTSWERYLNGRILAPKRAVVALAEVTGTSPIHLTTLWELAERAWSRAEARHDRTMEQIRISQAREALGGYESAGGGGRPPYGEQPAHVAAGAPAQGQADSAAAGRSGGPGRRRAAPSPGGHRAAPGGGSGPARGGGKRKTIMLLAGAVAALAVIVLAVLLVGSDDGGKEVKAAPQASPSPSAEAASSAPAVKTKCTGEECVGGDPQAMGCGGELAETVSSAKLGTARVEVRYSKACGAAWARLTDAAPGDAVAISVGGKGVQNGLVKAESEAYTMMTAVPEGAMAEACATAKATGARACTGEQ